MPGCAPIPAWPSTSPTRTHPGSAAPMKTPTACSASTSPRAQTSAATPPATWPPSPPPSIPDPARHSAGRHQPKLSTSTLTPVRKAVLRRLVESALGAAVRVEDHAGVRVAGGDSVAQRSGDQLSAQVTGHRVARHPAGGDIDHGGQEQPPFPGADIGDVTAPAGIEPGRIRGEVAADPVSPARGGRVRDRGLLPAPGRPAGQPGGAHQPGDALAAVPASQVTQLGVHPRRAVPAPGFLMHGPDLAGEI